MGVCDYYLGQITSTYDEAEWVYDSFIVPHRDWLVTYYSSAGWNITWRTHVALAISNLSYAVEYLIHCNTFKGHPLRLPYYLSNCIAAEPPEFTMGVLLSTMLIAEPSQIQGFVGITDAYRQSIWNKPFNKEFFAALARGFEQWE